MKLKSFFDKISTGTKKSPAASSPAAPGETPRREVPFDRQETKIEQIGPVGEIDVIVNNEKMNVHTLGPVSKIGRDPSQADIIIPELIVSKLHCTIYSQDQRFFIQDNNSTNCVYINHQRVIQQELKHGDIILLGKKGTVKLIFHIRR